MKFECREKARRVHRVVVCQEWTSARSSGLCAHRHDFTSTHVTSIICTCMCGFSLLLVLTWKCHHKTALDWLFEVTSKHWQHCCDLKPWKMTPKVSLKSWKAWISLIFPLFPSYDVQNVHVWNTLIVWTLATTSTHWKISTYTNNRKKPTLY